MGTAWQVTLQILSLPVPQSRPSPACSSECMWRISTFHAWLKKATPACPPWRRSTRAGWCAAPAVHAAGNGGVLFVQHCFGLLTGPAADVAACTVPADLQMNLAHMIG